MQDLRITLVQADQIWEDKKANFALYEKMLSETSETDLILLPEMFQTGFSMNTELAEDFSDSESLHWLQQLAKTKKAAIYTSLMIREKGACYNRGVFVQEDGSVHFYDKRKTFTLAKENEHYEAGKSACIVPFKGWNLQLQVCYDLRFPEILRNKWNSTNAQPSYDVLLFVANWPAKRGEHWRTLLKARAIENQCYVVAVNRVGEDHTELNYQGDSCVVDALGNMKIDFFQDAVCATTVLQHKDLEHIRTQLPFLQDQE